MRRYTTPTLTLYVADVDITAYDVYVTFKQGTNILTKTGDDLTLAYDSDSAQTSVAVTLTQAETALFDSSKAKDCLVQVNWVTSSGVRSATRVKAINVDPNLLTQEVEYGD